MRMSRLCVASSVLIMAVCLCVGFVQADQKTEELITKLEAKASTINSYRADLTMNMEMMGQKMVYTGNLSFKNPKKSRMEMNTKMGAMEIQQIIISNGKTTWTYQPKMKMVQKIDMEKIIAETGNDTGQKNGDPSHPFQSLNRDSIVYIRTDKIDGQDVYIFQGIPQVPETDKIPFIPSKLEIGLDANNGMLRKMVMFNKEGKEMMSQSYSNVQLNVDIPDSEFEFTPPEGVQVMDMTEGSLNMMKQMREKQEQPVANPAPVK